MTVDRLPGAARAVVLLVASLVLLGISGVEPAGRTSSATGAGSAAVGLLPPVLDDNRGSLAVLRAVLAGAGAQTAGTPGLAPVAGPAVAPPSALAHRGCVDEDPVIGRLAGSLRSRAPPVTTGT